MTRKTKRISLLLLVGALVSVVLLSASLSGIQLQAGSPFPGAENSANVIQSPGKSTPALTYPSPGSLLKGFFALVFLILAIVVPVRLLPSLDLKKILRLILVLIVLFIIVLNIPSVSPVPPIIQDEPIDTAVPPSFEYPVSPLGQPPQGFIWLVMTGLGLGVGVLVLKVFIKRLRPTRIKEQLLQDAISAVNAINAGDNLRNVILRCYLQMTRALQEGRSIRRSDNMTVREFESWLESNDLPAGPVHQLTRLFEKVRYGNRQFTLDEERIAVGSLNEIIRVCRNERDS